MLNDEPIRVTLLVADANKRSRMIKATGWCAHQPVAFIELNTQNYKVRITSFGEIFFANG